MESFVQEANTWVGLGLHPNIVTCYFVRVMGVPRIFIEYMDGGTLWDRLAQGTALDLKTSLDAAIQIARAMEYSHAKGLVHRDLKPGNCLLDSSGALKVTDFGLAKIGGADEPAAADAGQGAKIARVKDATRTGRLGTPEYMAPEQWDRPRESGPAADAWAFGAILYELFCGKKPFELADGEPADAFYVRLLESNWSYAKPGGLPESVAGLISLCLVLDPRGRTADFKQITAALESAYQKEMGVPYFREKVREVPPMAETLNNQGVSMADLGRNDEALRLFNLALKLDPTHPAAVHNHRLVGKGETYEHGLIVASAKEKWGADVFARLLERKKSHPMELEPRYLLAMAHARDGNT
ncbi:MAG: protein kinase, partial [Chloroflexota bacterium]